MSPTPPAKLFWLGLLLLFWAFYGLTGRDAWKAEEALALAPILDWLEGRAAIWATPAPLYTLVAGIAIKLNLAGGNIQDAARLASGLFTCLTLLFTGLGARALYGPGYGPTAAIALVGGFGLMLRAHALLPETALLAAWALLLYGVSAARKQPRAGAIAIGLALAALTLGLRGLLDLLAGLLIVGLPLLSSGWNERIYRQAVARGLMLAASLIGLGGVSVLLSGNWQAWLGWHGLAQLSALRMPGSAYSELPWFAWPLWPLALTAVWHEHRRLSRATDLHVPLLALAVLLVAALVPAWSRDGALLPVLLPLALLSAYALEHLRRGAAQGFYWFGVLFFACLVAALWIYFSALEWGYPEKLARHMVSLSPNYRAGGVDTVALLVAAVATLVWVIGIPLFPRAKSRPVLVWASGMIVVWLLVAALFRPWAESGWAYRPLIADLSRQLAAESLANPLADSSANSCLSLDVDPAMQTMLRLHLKTPVRANCPWTLKLAVRDPDTDKLVPDSNVVWEGVRPRQKAQTYRLLHDDAGQQD